MLRTPAAMRTYARAEHARGRRIGFVPTMGALHAGHAALLRAARKKCDRVVVSIFVNPAQFGPTEDFEAYPRTMAADRALCAEERVHAIFAPPRSALYPAKVKTSISVPPLQASLCALGRPGHFEGVCLIVAKLLHIVEPDVLFLGQKDAQQVAILDRMVRDLDFPARVVVVPTVRERDGLAMSSRNRYLDAGQRAYAPRLYESLRKGVSLIQAGERRTSVVLDAVRSVLLAPPLAADVAIEYVELVSAEGLEPLEEVPDAECLLALAVRVGRARLIDNVRVRMRPRAANRRARGG